MKSAQKVRFLSPDAIPEGGFYAFGMPESFRSGKDRTYKTMVEEIPAKIYTPGMYSHGFSVPIPGQPMPYPMPGLFDSDQSIIYNLPPSGFPSPQPSFPMPQPGFAQPQPGFAQPQPGFAQPQPGFSPSQPGFPMPQPGFPQPQPSFAQPPPGFAMPQPGFAMPQPGFEQPQPVFHHPVFADPGIPSGAPPPPRFLPDKIRAALDPFIAYNETWTPLDVDKPIVPSPPTVTENANIDTFSFQNTPGFKDPTTIRMTRVVGIRMPKYISQVSDKFTFSEINQMIIMVDRGIMRYVIDQIKHLAANPEVLDMYRKTAQQIIDTQVDFTGQDNRREAIYGTYHPSKWFLMWLFDFMQMYEYLFLPVEKWSVDRFIRQAMVTLRALIDKANDPNANLVTQFMILYQMDLIRDVIEHIFGNIGDTLFSEFMPTNVTVVNT